MYRSTSHENFSMMISFNYFPSMDDYIAIEQVYNKANEYDYEIIQFLPTGVIFKLKH